MRKPQLLLYSHILKVLDAIPPLTPNTLAHKITPPFTLKLHFFIIHHECSHFFFPIVRNYFFEKKQQSVGTMMSLCKREPESKLAFYLLHLLKFLF